MGVFHVFKIVQIAPNQAKRRICFLSLFLMHPTNENLSIMKLATWKKSWTHKNTHEILDPQNTDENNFGPTKYPREKILGSRNTHGKNLDPQNIYEKKFQTHEIPTRGTMALESQDLRWQVTQKNPSTLDFVREILNFIWRRKRVKMMFQQ